LQKSCELGQPVASNHQNQKRQTNQQGPFRSLALAVPTANSFDAGVVAIALVTSAGFPKPAKTMAPIAPAPMKLKNTRRRTIIVN
jgi:hypothetical protein